FGEAVRGGARLQLDFEAVVDEFVDRLLGRPMRQQQPSRTGRGRDLARLLRSEVAVRFAFRLVQRCLAEEDVGIAGELDQRRWPGRARAPTATARGRRSGRGGDAR